MMIMMMTVMVMVMVMVMVRLMRWLRNLLLSRFELLPLPRLTSAYTQLHRWRAASTADQPVARDQLRRRETSTPAQLLQAPFPAEAE